MINNFAKRCFGYLGVDVRLKSNIPKARRVEKHEELISRWTLLRRYKPKAVFDIGANEGQFAKLVREVLPNVPIFSFEPLSECFNCVDEYLLKNGPGRAFQCALGAASETASIHCNRFTPSSSLLPMQQLHKDEFPQSCESNYETVLVRTLDEIACEIEFETPLLIKIDVQGYEDRVITGGKETIKKAHAVILELTSYPLYEGQATFPEVHQQMADLGFVFRGAIDQLHSPLDSRILQFDGLFENNLFLP